MDHTTSHDNHGAVSDVDEPTGKNTQKVSSLIYNIRWMLVPMYASIWVALGLYVVKFFREVFLFGFLLVPTQVFGYNVYYISIHWHHSAEMLIWLLSLIDMVMVAQLVVTIVVSGYSNFVRKFELSKLTNRPRMNMTDVDSTQQKIKMALSLAGITAVDLLKIYIDIGTDTHYVLQTVILQIVIHSVLLISMLAFVAVASLNKH